MRNKWFEEQIAEFKTRSDNEVLEFLSSYWNITPDVKGVFTMVGTYKKADHKDKKGNDFAYFEDIRNTEGDILYYPFGLGKVKLWTACNDKLEKQDIWRISVKLSPKKFRDKNPFIITLADTKFGLLGTNLKDKLSREAQIRKIFKDTGFTERDAKNTVNALHNIMDDLYSNADDRFVYELLQNADDQPEEGKSVSVKLQLLKEHLLFMHNGRAFDTDDVDSICSIGDSTKRKDKEKIGYKGIGFKSVFTGSDTVIINSGNYSFAFDKYSPVYGDSDMNNIPWQLKPIWQERYRYPKEVKENETFWKSRVGISLEVGEDNLNNYRISIAKIFAHPIFLLFLKNVTNLEFDEGELRTKISKSHDGDILRIEKDGIVDSSWIVKDYPITIPQDIRDALQDDRNVPEKLKKATMTQISFAAKTEDGKIVKLENSVLYAYLPTSVNDFGFNFIVNADFLLAANREQLHVKKIWNQFLFLEIGKLLVDWVASLSKMIPSYLEILPNSLLNEEETGALSLSPFFNKAFTEALENKSFIRVSDEEAVKQEEIVIDKTGLSKIIGSELFLNILGSDKHLPSDSIDKSVFNNKIFEKVEKVTSDTVIPKMIGNTRFVEWFKSTDDENRNDFYNWLISKDCDRRRANIMSLVDNLPIYKFGDMFFSKGETISDLSKIAMRAGMEELRPIFEVCGYACSDNLDKLPIKSFFSNNIIPGTFDAIFKALLDSEKFSEWLNSNDTDSHKVLVNWLDSQYKPELKTKFEKFVTSMPLFHFVDGNYNGAQVDADPSRIIIDDNLDQVRDILTKIGFKCSNNISNSIFKKYIVTPKSNAVFESIRDKIKGITSDTLTPLEKLSLFNAIKNIEGIGEAKPVQTFLFGNQSRTHRKWLNIMTTYDANYPKWMEEYEIREEENFPEIQKYLVKKENVFNEIIKKDENFNDILKTVSLKDVYLQFKDSWTLYFTKNVINSKGTNESTLEMVEQQDTESKQYFLSKIDRLTLDVNKSYQKEDYISRILTLAFDVLSDEQLRKFASLIFVGERTLSSFTVSDDVNIEYHEGKIMHISLSELLPEYKDTGVIGQIKQSLAIFPETQLSRLLVISPMSTGDIANKINNTNGYTPLSYLFAIYRARKVYNHYNGYVPSIDLTTVQESWIHKLLDILYSQKIELYNDSFGYRLSPYFSTYFNSKYVLPKEQVLPFIESWAIDDDKRSYLISLGVKTDRSKLIQFRKNIIEDTEISSSDVEAQKDSIPSTIELFKNMAVLPFTGANQIQTMKMMELFNKYIRTDIDSNELLSNSVEYDLKEYVTWKNDKTISIYLYAGEMPRKLIKTNLDNLLLCKFNEGDYFYYSPSNMLFINRSCEVRDILYSIASDKNIPFSSSDWQQLFYDNLVTKDEVESRQKEIDVLKKQLERYREKYGDLDNKDSENSTKPVSKDENLKKDVIERPDLSQKEQASAHKEAEEVVREKLVKSGYDCSGWILDNEVNDGKWHSYNQIEGKIKDPDGVPVNVVVKSAKGGYIYLSATDFEFLTQDSKNLLLVWDGDDVHSVSGEDLFTKDSNVNLIFDTEYTPKHYYAALSKVFQYVKRTTFAVKDPKRNTYSQVQGFGMDAKTEGIQELFDDNDL